MDLWRGKLSWRRVAVLVRALQRDPQSALYGAICDAITADLPDDPDAVAMTEADQINALLTARHGPLYGLLRRMEHNQQLQMHQQGHEEGAALPEPMPLPADVLAKIRELNLMSMDSDVARAYFETQS